MMGEKALKFFRGILFGGLILSTAAITRAYGGNGLGLSIVRAIQEQEYGVLNRDNGVEFWFELDIAVN